jgi:hypothetical protein
MEQELIETFETFQNTKNIPDIFCVFVEQLKTIPAESLTPEVQAEVKAYFQDINKRIQEYDDQYKILMNELGLLCGSNTKTPIAQRFFESLLDFLNLMNQGPTLESNRKIMKVLALIDGTKSMGRTLDKTKNSLGNMFEEARKALKDNGLSEDLILMKIAGYRNYSSLKDKLLEVSPGWTSD